MLAQVKVTGTEQYSLAKMCLMSILTNPNYENKPISLSLSLSLSLRIKEKVPLMA